MRCWGPLGVIRGTYLLVAVSVRTLDLKTVVASERVVFTPIVRLLGRVEGHVRAGESARC